MKNGGDHYFIFTWKRNQTATLQIQDTENPGAGSYHIKQALGKGRPQIMNTNYEDQTLLHFKMVQLSGD